MEPHTSTTTSTVEPMESGRPPSPAPPPPTPTPAEQKGTVRSRLKAILFHPMFYAAVLIHGALLAVPGPPEEAERPEPESEEISITMLPPPDETNSALFEDEDLEAEPDAAEPEPEPLPPAEPPPQPAPAPPPPPVQEQAPPATVPEDVEPPADPEPQSSPEPAPQAFDPSGSRATAASNISNLAKTEQASLEPNLWSDDSYSQFFVTNADGNPQRVADPNYFNSAGRPTLREGIIPPITWQNDLRIENIRPGRSITGNPIVPPAPDQRITDSTLYLGSLYSDDIVVTQAGEYGGGPLFQVATQDGDVIEFLNPVPPKIKTAPSFYLIRWEFNPNEGPPAEDATTPS